MNPNYLIYQGTIMLKSILSASLFVMLSTATANAQSQTAIFEVMHQSSENERRSVVANNLQLSEAEEGEFWKKYDTYRSKVKANEKIRLGFANELSDNLLDMTEREADSLTGRALKLELKNKRLKEKHILSLKKVLADEKIFKYYQIETKLDAGYRYGWTRRIPLVSTSDDKFNITE